MIHSTTNRFARCTHGSASAQRGVVMLMVLVSLVVLLFAAVALVYSTDTALFSAGNMGFKRDLVNQSSRATSAAIQKFNAGGALYLAASREQDSAVDSYSSTILKTDGFPNGDAGPTHGIPAILLNKTTFESTYPNGTITDATSQVTLRYVIDRMCTVTGVVDKSTCVIAGNAADKGGTSWLAKAGSTSKPVYRISVLAIGPRNTQAFVQTTLTD